MNEQDPSGENDALPTNALGDLLAAVKLLTRLPVDYPGAEADGTGRFYWAFGLVGLAVAAPSAVVGAALIAAGAPPLAAGAVVMAAIALLTGGMHHDGLADIADSLGGKDPEQRLAITRDSSIGSFGAVGLVIVGAVFIASVEALAGHGAWAMIGGVVASASMSRSMMAIQRWRHDTPSEDGLAHLAGRPSAEATGVSVAAGLALAAVCVGIRPALAALLAGLAVTLLLGIFLQRWLGGVNGDGLGATQQLSEAAMLATLCAAAG